MGKFKLNCDGAVAVGDVTGCGGIIRDHEGHMVVAFANNLGR